MMPKLDINKVPEKYHPWVEPLIVTRGKTKGRIRTQKPKVPARVKVEDTTAMFGHRYVFENDEGRILGESAYVWRMVTFYLCQFRPYVSMPWCADMDVVGYGAERRSRCAELDVIVNAVLEQYPVSQQKGLLRWGRALGYF
jgi:hypothetical protein